MDVQKNSGLARTGRSHKKNQAVIQLCCLLYFVNYDISEGFCHFESPPEHGHFKADLDEIRKKTIL